MESKAPTAYSTTKYAVRSRGSIFAIVGMTLLALALGGSTELWGQSVIVLAGAIVLLLFPPRQVPGKIPLILLSLFFLLALSSFLPADWGSMPKWYTHLTVDLQAPLGHFRTPQPWLSLQACGVLFFCLVWMCYLLAQNWNSSEKALALQLLMAGVILLAAVAIAAFLLNYRIPGWNQEQNRGWFPNRNQSADVLALCGIVTYVLAFKSLQKRRVSAFFWTSGVVIIGVALVICYSRAGILLFFAGIGIWHGTGLFRRQGGKHVALGAAAGLLLLSLFFIFGGTTLDRFLKNSDPLHAGKGDYRISIQEDALRVSMQTPLLGVGLGNFEPVFTLQRQASADQNRTLHPESDWLWMAVEMGWLAPLLVLAGLRWWLGECIPFAQKAGESLRRAAMVAFVMFIIHGLVDVSGHRMGSVFVGLLMASVAMAPRARGFSGIWIASIFRILAVILVLLGTWWLSSVWEDAGPPTSATLDRLQARIDQDAANGNLASLSEAANAALEIAPMDWPYYFRRASTEAFRNGGTAEAESDFRIGRFLEPHSCDLCVYEAEVWLATDESQRCLDACAEALRRAGDKEVLIYTTLLKLSVNNPQVHAGLASATSDNVDNLIAYLEFATPEEATSTLDHLLARDPNLQTLSFDQQGKLFSAWWVHGDQDALARLLLTHAQWQLAGWKFLALHFAAQQDFELAAMTALRYQPRPIMPPLPSDQPVPTLESQFNTHPDDAMEGLQLYQAQVQANDFDGALATLSAIEKIKGCPNYIFYLQAQLYVKKQLWEQAWGSLQQLNAM